MPRLLAKLPCARTQLVLLALAWLSALSCASRQRIETEAAKALITPEQSEQLGKQVHEELQRQGVRYVDDPAITGYVERLMEPLIAQARQERPDIRDWHVHVIDDPKTLNAFATGGGHIYVYTGLLLAADQGAEVTGVLSHEVGHVVLYHIERQMVNAFGLQAITQLALGQNPAVAAKVAAAVTGQGLLLAHSRESELEADRYGVTHAAAAGYDPHGLVQFFERLQEEKGEQPRALVWLSTHPSTPDRIARVNQIIEEEKLAGSQRTPGALKEVQAQIRARG